jgi:NADPH-dependent 7-cyano-7-deazaguanine reductase QueF-like protein
MKYFNYHFNLININNDSFKWKNNYLNNFNSNRIDNFRAVNFESMSKKLVLNNLNKVLITDKNGVIIKITTLADLEKIVLTD